MSVKGKRSRAPAGHLEWGRLEAEGVDRSVLGKLASSELVERNGKKSVSYGLLASESNRKKLQPRRVTGDAPR